MRKLELLAYGPIGGWMGLSAQSVAERLQAERDAEEIVVRMHSEGGDALDGIAIANALRHHPARVVCYVDGLAGSAASMIAMGADEVVMAESALMMLHNPWGLAIGDGEEMRQQADVLDTIGRAYVKGYTQKTGRSEEEIKALMERYSWRTGTWLTAEQAVAEKLADRVGPPVAVQARAAELRAAALAAAPLSLRQILVGAGPALPGAQAPRSDTMTLKDWAARLKAAKTEEQRVAILAEMDKEEETRAEGGGDEEEDKEDKEEETRAEGGGEGGEDEDKDGDDEKQALRVAVDALKARVREMEDKKAAAAPTPEQWAEQQVKAGYPQAKRAELLALRRGRPAAAELAAKTVLEALPQAKRGQRWTEGGAPLGTTPEQALPREEVIDQKRRAEEIVQRHTVSAFAARTKGL